MQINYSYVNPSLIPYSNEMAEFLVMMQLSFKGVFDFGLTRT